MGGTEMREDAVAEDGACGDETLAQRDKFPLLSLCNWRKVAYLRNWYILAAINSSCIRTIPIDNL